MPALRFCEQRLRGGGVCDSSLRRVRGGRHERENTRTRTRSRTRPLRGAQEPAACASVLSSPELAAAPVRSFAQRYCYCTTVEVE